MSRRKERWYDCIALECRVITSDDGEVFTEITCESVRAFRRPLGGKTHHKIVYLKGRHRIWQFSRILWNAQDVIIRIRQHPPYVNTKVVVWEPNTVIDEPEVSAIKSADN